MEKIKYTIAEGDILNKQIIKIVFDGTNWQVVGALGSIPYVTP